MGPAGLKVHSQSSCYVTINNVLFELKTYIVFNSWHRMSIGERCKEKNVNPSLQREMTTGREKEKSKKNSVPV